MVNNASPHNRDICDQVHSKRLNAKFHLLKEEKTSYYFIHLTEQASGLNESLVTINNPLNAHNVTKKTTGRTLTTAHNMLMRSRTAWECTEGHYG